MHERFFPLFFLVAGVIPGGSSAAVHEDTTLERCAQLESALPELASRAGVPGVAVAVAHADGVRWHTAHGVRDTASGAPVDGDTVFEAASLSKPVFAYAVLQLVGEGVLDLDAPLIDYARLAELAGDPRHREVTARMVLGHTTGLPNWRPSGAPLAFGADPGAAWQYSGEGFVLLQRVVEELVGDTLQGLATSLVFEPLGMTRSSFVWRPAFAANLALPHDADGTSRAGRRVTEPNAAFSLLTTATDYARFLAALLRGEGLTAELHAALLRPVTDVNEGVFWGLGVGLEHNADGHGFWHWGHNGGYRAYTVGYPSRDFAVVYFTNSDNGMRFLADLVELATGEAEHPAIEHLDYATWEPTQAAGADAGGAATGRRVR